MAEIVSIPENGEPSFDVELTQTEQDQITDDLNNEGLTGVDPVKAAKAILRYLRRKWDER